MDQTTISLLKKLLALKQQLLALLLGYQPVAPIMAPTAPSTPNQPIMTPTPETLYEAAKAALGTHLTLDNNVPGDLGCMEAVSKLWQEIGIENIPSSGFEGTAQGLAFMEHSFQFVEKTLSTIAPGDVIDFATGTSTKGSPHGHILIMGHTSLMSNDSDTGLFAAKYSLATALQYFRDTLGFPPRIFGIKPA